MTAATAAAAAAGDPRARWRGHGAMLLFALFVSGSFSLGARAAPFIDPNALMAVRFMLATAVLLGVMIGQGLARGARPAETLGALQALRQAPWRFLLLGALYGAYFVLMFEALRLAPPASLGAVFTLTPLMSAGFAVLLLGQRTPMPVLSALLIGGAGAVWVVFRGDLDALLALRVGLGEGLFFIGAVAHALYTPLLRTLNRGEPGPVFVLGSTAAAMLVVSIVGLRALAETDWTALPAIVWIAVAYLGVITTAGTATLLQYAAMRLPAPRVMAYTYLVPSLVILLEGLTGAGWAEAAILPGVAATLVSLALLLRE